MSSSHPPSEGNVPSATAESAPPTPLPTKPSTSNEVNGNSSIPPKSTGDAAGETAINETSKPITKATNPMGDGRRLIRTIRPIDVRKLQQSGLDRKIAEALSKQKQATKLNTKPTATTQQSLPTKPLPTINSSPSSASNVPSNNVNSVKKLPTASGVSTASTASAPSKAAHPTVHMPVKNAAAALKSPSAQPKSTNVKPIIPPKITITAPETTSPSHEVTKLPTTNDLTPEQRMKHVKSLLHQKLMQRQNSSPPTFYVNEKGQKQYAHLKPPSNVMQQSPPPLQPPAPQTIPNPATTPSTPPSRIFTKNSKQLLQNSDVERRHDQQFAGDPKVPINNGTQHVKARSNAAAPPQHYAISHDNQWGSTPNLYQKSGAFLPYSAPSSSGNQSRNPSLPNHGGDESPFNIYSHINPPASHNLNMTQHNFKLNNHNRQQPSDQWREIFQDNYNRNANHIPYLPTTAAQHLPSIQLHKSMSYPNLNQAPLTTLANKNYGTPPPPAPPPLSVSAMADHSTPESEMPNIPYNNNPNIMIKPLNANNKNLLTSPYIFNKNFQGHALQHSTPSNKLPTKPKTPQKSPQDIARKLDFDGQTKPPTTIAKPQYYTAPNVPQISGGGDCDIPKASVKPVHTQISMVKQSEASPASIAKQRIVVPDVSPLKTPFPTANVPQEAPLPNIDIFKKPYPSPNQSYYQMLTHNNVMEPPTTSYHLANNTSDAEEAAAESVANTTSTVSVPFNNSLAPNSLIVLENKVLSQDEMIDLTALRLSTSKFDAPQRFARPHKPIPEVVIKQENPDDFPAAESTSSSPKIHDSAEQTSVTAASPPLIQPLNSQNPNQKGMVLISSRQNKKIIVNASKLQLPPEKIADLAKIIAQRAVNKASNTSDQTGKISGGERQLQIGKTTGEDLKPKTIAGQKVYLIVRKNTTPQKSDENTATTPAIVSFTNKQVPLQKQNFNTPYQPQPTLNHESCQETMPSKSTKLSYTPTKYLKPAVEIVDEPMDEDDEEANFSAVDFIASLANNNPITEETQLELSPEELNLNASCAMNLSPLRIPNAASPRRRHASTSQFTTPGAEDVISPRRVRTNSHMDIGKVVNMNSDDEYNSSYVPMVDTIIIESSKGRDVLRKSVDNGEKDSRQTPNYRLGVDPTSMWQSINTIGERGKKSSSPKVTSTMSPQEELKQYLKARLPQIKIVSPSKLSPIKKDMSMPRDINFKVLNMAEDSVEDLNRNMNSVESAKEHIGNLNEKLPVESSRHISGIGTPTKDLKISDILSASHSDGEDQIRKILMGTSVRKKKETTTTSIDVKEISVPNKEERVLSKRDSMAMENTLPTSELMINTPMETEISVPNREEKPQQQMTTDETPANKNDNQNSAKNFEQTLSNNEKNITSSEAATDNETLSETYNSHLEKDNESSKEKEAEPITKTLNISDKDEDKSKSGEPNSIVSKRISRFKKGKINLVQRNKPTAPTVGPRKPNKEMATTNNAAVTAKENAEQKLKDTAISSDSIKTKGDIGIQQNKEIEPNSVGTNAGSIKIAGENDIETKGEDPLTTKASSSEQKGEQISNAVEITSGSLNITENCRTAKKGEKEIEEASSAEPSAEAISNAAGNSLEENDPKIGGTASTLNESALTTSGLENREPLENLTEDSSAQEKRKPKETAIVSMQITGENQNNAGGKTVQETENPAIAENNLEENTIASLDKECPSASVEVKDCEKATKQGLIETGNEMDINMTKNVFGDQDENNKLMETSQSVNREDIDSSTSALPEVQTNHVNETEAVLKTHQDVNKTKSPKDDNQVGKSVFETPDGSEIINATQECNEDINAENSILFEDPTNQVLKESPEAQSLSKASSIGTATISTNEDTGPQSIFKSSVVFKSSEKPTFPTSDEANTDGSTQPLSKDSENLLVPMEKIENSGTENSNAKPLETNTEAHSKNYENVPLSSQGERPDTSIPEVSKITEEISITESLSLDSNSKNENNDTCQSIETTLKPPILTENIPNQAGNIGSVGANDDVNQNKRCTEGNMTDNNTTTIKAIESKNQAPESSDGENICQMPEDISSGSGIEGAQNKANVEVDINNSLEICRENQDLDETRETRKAFDESRETGKSLENNPSSSQISDGEEIRLKPLNVEQIKETIEVVMNESPHDSLSDNHLGSEQNSFEANNSSSVDKAAAKKSLDAKHSNSQNCNKTSTTREMRKSIKQLMMKSLAEESKPTTSGKSSPVLESAAQSKELQTVQISLADIVKNPSTTGQQTPPPKIPFKRPINRMSRLEQIKGIRDLLNKIKKPEEKEVENKCNNLPGADAGKSKTNEECQVTLNMPQPTISIKKLSDLIPDGSWLQRKRHKSEGESETVPECADSPSGSHEISETPSPIRRRRSTRLGLCNINESKVDIPTKNAEVKMPEDLKTSKNQSIPIGVDAKDINLPDDSPTKDKENQLKCSRRTRRSSKPGEKNNDPTFVEISTEEVGKRTRHASKTADVAHTPFDKLKDTSFCPLKRIRLCSKSSDTEHTSERLPHLSSSLDISDSCHDSTTEHNSGKISSLSPRKRLRKTLDDIKKSHKIASDSEDEREFDSISNGYGDEEGPSDFLGFEDNSSLGSSSKCKTPDTHSMDGHEKNSPTKASTTKGGTLKNWLTTGKAISPTSIKDGVASITTRQRQRSMPLKKRWDAKQKSIEETDITDDSTPANDEDDDDEEKEKNAIAEALDEKKIKGNKRSVKTVINSDKDSLSAKRRKKDNKEEACNSNVSSNTKKSIAEPKSVVTSLKGETTNKISETDSDTPSAVGRRVKRPRRRLISDDFVMDAKNNRESNDKVNESPKVEITVEEKPASRRKQRFPQKEMQNEIEIIEPSENNTATNESLVETNDTDEELLIPMPSKRKRERKKKYDVNIPESDATNTPAAKAKREISIKPTTSSRRRSKIDRSQAVEEVNQQATKESLEVSQINETAIEQTEEFTTPSKPKGKRGRKKKILTECTLSTSLLDDEKVESPQKTVEPLNVSQPCEISIEQTEEFTTPQPKGKRGRKKKIPNEIDTPEISTPQSDEPKTPAAQSRPRHRTAENQFNVRLLLITKREQLDTDEVLTFESNPGSGPIQCGLCLKRTTESKWIIHLSQHYGVGWKIGEQEVETDYRPSVLNAIITFLKDTELKGLACRMCNKLYRSGLGLLTHIENCGSEAQRADCEYCHRNYALSTLTAHVRSCPEKFKQLKETESSDAADIADTAPAEEQVLSVTGRAKRHSTIKAETKIKQLGADLITNAEEKHDFNPQDFIRYTAPLGDDVREKWSSDIRKFEKAFCPNKLCQFVSDKIEELEQHIASCRFIAKPGYYCTSCKRRRFETEKEAVTHVNATHHPKEDFSLSDSDCNIKTDDEQSSDDGDNDLSDAVEEDENELNDVETAKSSKRKRTSKAMPTGISFRKRVFEKRNRDGPNKMVLEKWLNFTSLNYSMKPLFENFKPQYAKCNRDNLEKYLPNQNISMKFVMSTKKKLPPAIGLPPDGDEEWQQIERFEKFHYESDAICFVGAPIISCSWIPLPNDVREQYLLVAYRRDMFKFTKFQNPKRFKTSLVLFKVTQNKMHGKRVPEMHVHYIIAIENGPVYNMAFLPSGGYNLEDNRLGLVAVATADSNINIYALPIEVSPKAENSNDLTVIELKPSFELMIDIMSQHGSSDDHVLLNPQCLQICWSEFNGHNHIFASYSNGCLGMWDISDDAEENLNRFEVNGIIQYAPLNYFYVGEKGVRYFAVHYDSLGPRWLALNCFYRKFLIYDIRNFNLPIPLKEDYARNVVRGLEWCPLWEPVMVAYCDAIPNNGRSVLLINPTNIMSQQQKLDFVVSAVTGVHYNPWTNMCVESVDNGDIVFMDCREMHYELVLGRKFGERRILSSMDIKQLDGTPLKRLTDVKENEKLQMEWSMYDNDYKEKYGLVLQPLIKLKESLKSTYLSEKRRAPINVTPYLRINTLRCNLNKSAKKLVAVGYENGFIRIIHFDKDSQFRDW